MPSGPPENIATDGARRIVVGTITDRRTESGRMKILLKSALESRVAEGAPERCLCWNAPQFLTHCCKSLSVSQDVRSENNAQLTAIAFVTGFCTTENAAGTRKAIEMGSAGCISAMQQRIAIPLGS